MSCGRVCNEVGEIIKFNKNKFRIKNRIQDIKKTINKQVVKEIVIKFLTFIGELIAAIFAIMEIYDWINGHKELDIVVSDNVSVTFLNESIKQHNNFYPLFGDYIDFDKECQFIENCATQLMITNHYNNEVVIDKIVLEANEIKVDYSPVLTFSDVNSDVFEEGLGVTIVNTGWGAAKNLKVKMVGEDKDLEKYLKKEALEFTVPIVDSAEQVEIPVLKDSDLLGNIADGTNLKINFEVECECEGTPIIYSEVMACIYEGKFARRWGGGLAEQIYGIEIDTTKDKFLLEESITEFIDQGETLALPICFFPDKSCSLKLKISLEIVNDGIKEMISTEIPEMYFTVSSIQNPKISCSFNDIKAMSKEEMEK